MTFTAGRAKDPLKCPRTRRELLQHLWAAPDLHDTNVFKEGPYYTVRKGRVTAATHTRTIDSRSFAGWEQFVRNVPQGVLA
jgi:hypothetical protein